MRNLLPLLLLLVCAGVGYGKGLSRNLESDSLYDPDVMNNTLVQRIEQLEKRVEELEKRYTINISTITGNLTLEGTMQLPRQPNTYLAPLGEK